MKTKIILLLISIFVYTTSFAQNFSLLKDINVGTNNSSPAYCTNVNDILFFTANNGIHGKELWKSDGTEAGTVLVKDINIGSNSSNPENLTNVNGVLFFTADNGLNGKELWKSDGTEAGTVLVKDINIGSNSSNPVNLTNVNGILFFSGDDSFSSENTPFNTELWKSDGTEAGTIMIKDIYIGGNSLPRHLTNVNGVLFFSAFHPNYGRELWRSDGTEAGTVLVKDIWMGPSYSGLESTDLVQPHLTNVNGILFFRAVNGYGADQLWRSDGTEIGTTLIKNFNIPSISSLVNADGTLFFTANRVYGPYPELWRSDGTEAGTVLVKSSVTAIFPTNVNGVVFFAGNDGIHGYEIWKSDGTEAGTVMVKNIRPVTSSNYPYSLTNINGTLFFSFDDMVYDYEPWKSDGTEAGTAMVSNINPSGGSNIIMAPSAFTLANNKLFTIAYHPDYGYELWTMNISAPPSTPNSLIATTFSQTQINLSWVDVAINETGYKLERSPDGSSNWVEIASLPANITSYSNNSLAANTTYYYRVRAYNTYGNSEYSNITHATTLPLPPSNPSSLIATTISSSQIDLSWTDNSNNETVFKVERSPNGSNNWVEIASLPANTVTYSNTNLMANTSYYYRVKAINTGGDSEHSNIASATTLLVNEPNNLTTTTISSSQIDLSWTDNSNNETGFKIEQSLDGLSNWTEIVSLSANFTNYSNTGLAPNTSYHYRVRAYNGSSFSAYSNIATTTTLPLPPSTPNNLTINAISQTQINLSWTDNSNNETGFKVERSPDGSNNWAEIVSLPVNSTNYSDSNLMANTAYYYRVKAYNMGGNSVYTNVASATTLPLRPIAPTNLTMIATTSSSQIDLSWTDNSNNETGFKIERSPDGSNNWVEIASLPANTITYSNSNLMANTSYYYRVKAINTGGDSEYSNVVSARTLEEPSPTNIEDELNKNIVIYPNPTQGRLSIDITKLNAQNIQIELYNIVGHKIQQQNTKDTIVYLDITNLPKGIYILHISTQQGKTHKKIILE